MKIIIDRNTNDAYSERQWPVYTIDTSQCHYPYAIRGAIERALELDGYTKETIADVMNRPRDTFQGGTGLDVVSTPPSVFSREMIEKIQDKKHESRYFLGTDIQGPKFAYCLTRDTNGVITVVLSNEHTDKEEFDRDLAAIELLYSPTIIRETVTP